MLVAGVGKALAADFLDQARHTFEDAYNTQNYPEFCSMIDPNAAYRGALLNQWTFTADQIVKRFKAPCTCTEYATNPKCGLTETLHVTPMTIGPTTLVLAPAAPATGTNSNSPGDSSYAMDSGIFTMQAKPGKNGVTTTGSYVILWIHDGSDWKIMHMDMTKTGN